MFLLMKKMECLNGWEDIKVYSDRYLMKSLDLDFLEGEKIVLVDDSLITGKHLRRSIQIIQERTKVSEIIPRIFAAEECWNLQPELKITGKVKTVNWHILYSYSDILKLSSIESLLFYYCEIPYMIELPVLQDIREKEISYSILFQKDEFELLKISNNIWEYYDCPQLGYLQNDMTSGVLVFKNHIFKKKFSNFIQNMVVRLQILNEDTGIKIIFIPFAILKSVKFEELYDFFQILYEDTSYLISIKLYEEECKNRRLCFEKMASTAIYRAVVYSLSLYIGKELKEYLKICFSKKLVFCNDLYKYNFESSFCKSVEQIIEETHEKYIFRVLRQKRFLSIPCRPELEHFSERYFLQKYDYKRVYNFMLEVINDLHHESVNQGENIESSGVELITIEEFEQLFTHCFYMEDYGNVDNCMSRCICSMLCQGVFVNELRYEEDSHVIYRGFSYGENSDAFYDISAKVFYAAVLKYYELIGKEYTNKYHFFVMNLYRFFKENMLFDSFISESEFNFYAKYFRNAGEEKFQYQIENKRFLLDDRTTPYYIQMVENFISNLVWDKENV